MKAIVFNEAHNMKEVEVSLPEKKKGYSLLKMNALGVCGSDIHAFSGKQPMFSYPKIIGHEISATVVSSEQFEENTTVTVIPYLECGECVACRNGKENACANLSVLGVHVNGGLSEYISVPDEKILTVHHMKPEQIAMIEPLSISEHAVSRSALKKGEYVLVSGIGPIGMGIVVMARYRGAKVIAVDMNQERLNYAQSVLGAEHILTPSPTLIKEVEAITQGDMVTKVFDATGNSTAMNKSIDLLAQGGTIVFVGLHNDDVQFPDLAFHKREASLLASRAAYRDDFENVITMIQSGFFDPSQFITEKIHFDQVTQTFSSAIKNPKQIKTLITF